MISVQTSRVRCKWSPQYVESKRDRLGDQILHRTILPLQKRLQRASCPTYTIDELLERKQGRTVTIKKATAVRY